MKKHYNISLLVAVFLVFSISASTLPPPDPLQAIQNDINAGRALNEAFKKAKEKTIEAANDLLNNPLDPTKAGKFVEALGRQAAAAVALVANRNKVINDVIAHFGLVVPPGQQITYDINCKGECVHGYCSLKCPIGLCEKAFNPQPWGGGGTPAWIAAIIKHELEHKKQINAGPPPTWTNSEAQGEYEAWQAALKCAETSGLSDVEKNKIIEIKKYWLDRWIAEIVAEISRILSEWMNNFEHGLRGSMVNTSIHLTNYSDSPQMTTCVITNQRNWLVEPNLLTAFLEPGQEMNFPVVVHVPDTAIINTKNEVFCLTQSPMGSTSDFMFVLVDPTVNVTAGPNLLANRGETVPFSFLVENSINAQPDTVLIELTNSLDWPIDPPFFEAVLMPGEQFTFLSLLHVPPIVPPWTTNLVYCRATSIHDVLQTEKKWFSVQVRENDISALMIEAPLGEYPKESVLTPAAWAYNAGMEDSFFDFFVKIDFPLPYTDSLKGIFMPPGHDMMFAFNPVILNETGTFNVKFYARAMCCDANHDNDTITGAFSVTLPDHIYIQNVQVGPGEYRCYEAAQSITTGGSDSYFIVQGGAVVNLVAGQQISMLPYAHFLNGSYVHAYIDPTGQFCHNLLSPVATNEGPVLPQFTGNAVPNGASFFRIYPNPTTGNFTLELVGDRVADEVTVEIYGLLGEKVLTEKIPSDVRHEFSLAWKPAGIYIVRVLQGNKSDIMKLLKL